MNSNVPGAISGMTNDVIHWRRQYESKLTSVPNVFYHYVAWRKFSVSNRITWLYKSVTIVLTPVWWLKSEFVCLCHHCMARPHVANGETACDMGGKVDGNKLKEQSRTADKVWPSILGFWRGANNLSPKKQNVKKYSHARLTAVWSVALTKWHPSTRKSWHYIRRPAAAALSA
jgi:hypothetical protein